MVQGEDAGALVALIEALKRLGYTFTTVTPSTHERVNRRPCAEQARNLRDVFGWSRPFDEALLPAEIVETMRRSGVLVRDGERWRSAIRVSSLDGELFVHSAFPPSAVDAVFFGPDTFRFVTAVVAHLDGRASPVRRAVDIGCGSGAAGIAIAKRSPDAEVVLVDINDAALRTAAINACSAGIEVKPRKSDLLAAVDGSFDLIVSNPPFMVDRSGRTYRHGGGRFGEGLSLAVVEAATERLVPGGSLVLFTGSVIVDGEDPFRAAATAACERAGLDVTYLEFDPDEYGEELDDPAYAEADRIALVVLTATRGNAR